MSLTWIITKPITSTFEGINLVTEVPASFLKVSQQQTSSNALFDSLILSSKTGLNFHYTQKPI
jgi:hypothetical protein